MGTVKESEVMQAMADACTALRQMPWDFDWPYEVETAKLDFTGCVLDTDQKSEFEDTIHMLQEILDEAQIDPGEGS